MTPPKTVLLGLLNLLLFFCQASDIYKMWHPVSVPETYVMNTSMAETKSFSRLVCGMACAHRSWCNLWCKGVSPACIMSQLLVSSAYKPAVGEVSLECFTIRKRVDYAVNALVTGMGNPHWSSTQPSTLVDGMHNWEFSGCYYTGSRKRPYIVFELPGVKTINEIRIMTEPYERLAQLHFTNVTVFVGQELQIGDFSSYTSLGTFDGPATFNQEIVFNDHTPVEGKFITLYRNHTYHFGFCYIEIR